MLTNKARFQERRRQARSLNRWRDWTVKLSKTGSSRLLESRQLVAEKKRSHSDINQG